MYTYLRCSKIIRNQWLDIRMINVENLKNEKAVLKRIRKLIADPPEQSRVVEFTPAISQKVLTQLNVGNRTRKPQKIKEYADDMAAGQWGLTGATIVFGTDGLLKDGQNRLAACVQSGCSFETHVVFGVNPQLFAKMDVGRVRNAGDIFTIAGIKNANDVAAGVRWLDILTSENPLSRDTRTPDYLLKRYQERYSGVSDSISTARTIRRNCAHPVGNVAALHYMFSKVDPDKADEFCQRWATGMRNGNMDPISNMQSEVQAIKTTNYGRIHEAVRNALIIKAWNNFYLGKKVSRNRMKWSMGDGFPKIEGLQSKPTAE